MTYLKFLVLIVCVQCKRLQFTNALSQPADLGSYNSHNDIPNGLSSFSLPAEERFGNVDAFILSVINYTYTDTDGRRIQYSQEKGKYGEGKVANVIGRLVHVTDRDDVRNHTACTPFIRGTNGRDLPEPGTWIALVKRGKCNFEDKVEHVYRYGAIGVLVYNDRDSSSLDKMKIQRDRNITAVFTHKWLGEEMARLSDDGNDLTVSLSEGRHSRMIPNINRTSVLFVSISFIVLMIISLVWLIFYYVQRFRYLQTKDRKSRQLCSVAKRIIAKIPTKNIKSDDKEIENDCCAVCIEPYKVTDLIRMLPCRHDFHKSCIDPWLLEHRTCPMCKMDILKHYGFVFTGSQESILQLDLDTEIGDGNGLAGGGHGTDDTIRARSASPTFVIQLDHESNRRNSVASMVLINRDEQTTSTTQYAVTEINQLNKCQKCSATVYSNVKNIKNHSSGTDDDIENIKESISLPCTLRKCKSADSCRGSNNCYVWALDCDHLARKMEKLEKGCPKSRTICNDNNRNDSNSDNEFLLGDKNIYENSNGTPGHDGLQFMSNDATCSSTIATNSVQNDSELRRRSSVVCIEQKMLENIKNYEHQEKD